MLVFTFPGQGSQRSGMGRDWMDHPSWEVVTQASSVLGVDVAHLLLECPMDELTMTNNAQLATFVQSLIVFDAVTKLGVVPAVCAGHSLGEYTALVASGTVSFEDGLRLVSVRGEAMAKAGTKTPGTMAVLLGITDANAEALCRKLGDGVWIANYNASGQVVISGTLEAVAEAISMAKEFGARKIMPIPVSGAFHTPLMLGAASELESALAKAKFSKTQVEVVANVDAQVNSDPSQWPNLLSKQLSNPVRWHQSLKTIDDLGASIVIELGPGGVLSGLAKRTLPNVTTMSLEKPDDLDVLLEEISTLDALRSELHLHQGEHLYMSERVVVSPCTGVFAPEVSLAAPGTGLLPGTSPTSSGDIHSEIHVGDVVGRTGEVEVRTPFEGRLVRWLAASGERVEQGQPLVWLRVPGAAW